MALTAALGAFTVTSAAAAAKKGGAVTIGIEAETTGGLCLPKAQLAISGIQEAAAVYDTLMVPNTKGKYVPYLAKSVTPNADFTQWTITLRPGIKFYNGEDLNADAVKLNFDAYRKGILFSLLLKNIASVDVVDPLTVKVTMTTPWPAFPSYLYYAGRVGIAAPEQINSPDCAEKWIGTGPFMLKERRLNEKTVVVKNPNYWQKGYPLLDEIDFVPQPDGPQRIAQLQGGQFDIIHVSGGKELDKLEAATPKLNLMVQKPGVREVRYYLLNDAKPPFNSIDGRKAFGYAIDRDQINQIVNDGRFDLTDGPYDRRSPGYLSHTGTPQYNPKKAKALVSKVKAANGGQFNVTFLTTTDSNNLAEAQLLKNMVEKVGMHADIAQFDQSGLISQALGGQFSVLLWRNLHSDLAYGDPGSFPWWAQPSQSFVNFGKFDDPQIQAALDKGRTTSVETATDPIYAGINKRLGNQVYNLWVWYTTWTIAARPGIKGLAGPPIPDGGGKQLFIYGRFPVHGISRS